MLKINRVVAALTRELVQAAIAELNYLPNPAAQLLAGVSRERIGLLYSNPSAINLSEFLVGSLEQVSRANIGLVIQPCEPDAIRWRVVARFCPR